MNCIKLLFRAKPIFYGKKGHWGESGWYRINWFTWLCIQREHVNKVRWVKRRRNSVKYKEDVMKERFKKFWQQFKCKHKRLLPIYHSYKCLDCLKILWD